MYYKEAERKAKRAYLMGQHSKYPNLHFISDDRYTLK